MEILVDLEMDLEIVIKWVLTSIFVILKSYSVIENEEL